MLKTNLGNRNLSSIENSSLCTVGPVYIRSFSEFLDDALGDESKTTHSLVVELSGFNTR